MPPNRARARPRRRPRSHGRAARPHAQAPHSTPSAYSQSQRDCVLQPRVARRALPWVTDSNSNQPQRGCANPPWRRGQFVPRTPHWMLPIVLVLLGPTVGLTRFRTLKRSPHSTPSAHSQSQRDCVLQPRVARHALPWVTDANSNQPQRGCANPLWRRGQFSPAHSALGCLQIVLALVLVLGPTVGLTRPVSRQEISLHPHARRWGASLRARRSGNHSALCLAAPESSEGGTPNSVLDAPNRARPRRRRRPRSHGRAARPHALPTLHPIRLFPIPKGLRPPARGCASRATLGKTDANSNQPQRGCAISRVARRHGTMTVQSHTYCSSHSSSCLRSKTRNSS